MAGSPFGHRVVGLTQPCAMTDLVADPTLGVWEACWHYLVLGVVQGITEFCPSAAQPTSRWFRWFSAGEIPAWL